MMIREPRPWVTKLHAQRIRTTSAVREPDQVDDVDPQPERPRDEPALASERPEPRDVRDAAQAPDDGDVAAVPVAERLRRLAAQSRRRIVAAT